MRLIDADALLEKVRNSMKNLYGEQIQTELIEHLDYDDDAYVFSLGLDTYVKTKQQYQFLKQYLISSPTAYDVDKVVEQLRNMYIPIVEDSTYELVRKREAIEIVNKGGAE